MIGISNSAGLMYTPTASKKGAKTNENMARAIAATIPIAADLKNFDTTSVHDLRRWFIKVRLHLLLGLGLRND
jgi:hypothetical protein